MNFWQRLTDFGDASFLFSFAIGVTLWLALRPSRRAVGAWVLAFGCAVAIVVATKLAFMGWGIGIESLDFTGVSGHSTLAGAIFPVFAFLATSGRSRPTRRIWVGLAVLLALLIGLSRVILQYHSRSEVVVGLGLGLSVAALVIGIAPLADQAKYRWLVPVFVIGMLVPGLTFYGHRARSQGLLAAVAMKLSGRASPYSRAVWHADRVKTEPRWNLDSNSAGNN